MFRILLSSIEELQQQFDHEVSESAKVPAKYARNLLEYCCFRALGVSTRLTDYLSDKEFRRLTFEMMLAWESPGAADKPIIKVRSSLSGSSFKAHENLFLLTGCMTGWL